MIRRTHSLFLYLKDVNGIDEPEEEEEEVDINIDEGFLSDSSGEPVNVPAVETVETVSPRF